jgi:hypothetical protein
LPSIIAGSSRYVDVYKVVDVKGAFIRFRDKWFSPGDTKGVEEDGIGGEKIECRTRSFVV